MRLKNFLHNEDGAVTVIFAISFAVLLGFGALAIDYGQMTSTKRSLQNAADAAALAAAAELPANNAAAISNASSVARDYAQRNGVADTALNVVTIHPTTSTVEVMVKQDVTMMFSQVLTGNKTSTITARATAKMGDLFDGLDYAILGGSEVETAILINGNHSTIYGDVHSNHNIRIRGTDLHGSATSVGSNNGTIPVTTGAPQVQLPSLAGLLASTNVVTLTQSELLRYGVSVSGTSISTTSTVLNAIMDMPAYEGKVIRLVGNLTYDTSSANPAKGNLIVSGNITFNGSGQAVGDLSHPGGICLISETGNITFNGSGGDFVGKIFAPEGTVTLNGTGGTIYGSIIADVVRCNGGGLTVDSRIDPEISLPGTKVHLIK